ncbi:hypothetical protein NMY22_g20001 [Coprinellus aureogranulatus]|nr:hypothetical protein NMY22_g20001 [Coprinellus aureogranulatus]
MPGDITTTLNYAVPHSPSDPLFKHIFAPPPGVPRKNFDFNAYPAVIRDARGTNMETTADLDIHGFRYVKHQSKETEFTDGGED